jgi:N-methylhydantoinase A
VDSAAQLRYLGQNYELEVALPGGPMDEAGWRALLERFAAEHERQYGFNLPGEVVELTGLRATASMAQAAPAPPPAAVVPAVERTRTVVFEDAGAAECRIVRRPELAPGAELAGPVIVEEADSTTLTFPGDRVTVHSTGVLVVELGARS